MADTTFWSERDVQAIRTRSNSYPKGVKVTPQEMQAINIVYQEFHGERNYTISSNQQHP